jgi:CheY-like chemotaxis protein
VLYGKIPWNIRWIFLLHSQREFEMDEATATSKTTLKVLVVEDDAMIRLAACSALEEAGFEVFEAADGEEGLAILRENPSIDVVFSDISMPRMDGITMLTRARELRPDLRAVLTSGFSKAPSGEAFLRKPYGPTAARDMIVHILGR